MIVCAFFYLQYVLIHSYFLAIHCIYAVTGVSTRAVSTHAVATHAVRTRAVGTAVAVMVSQS